MLTNSAIFNNCMHCHYTQIPGFIFVKNCCEHRSKTKELSLSAIYVAISRVRCSEDIIIEVPFTNDRLDQIKRINAFADRLVFEHYQRQLTTESILENEHSTALITNLILYS